MSGLFGGLISFSKFQRMGKMCHQEPWYNSEISNSATGVGIIHHGDRNDVGTLWQDGDRAGVIYGDCHDRHDNESDGELFNAVLENPAETLPELEGSFVIAVIDESTQSLVVATDKVGSRPCHVSTTGGTPMFSTEIKPIVDGLESVELNIDAIGDLIEYGYILGKKTLVQGISKLEPGTFVTVSDGETTVSNYWSPDVESVRYEGDEKRTVELYRNAIADVSENLSNSTGAFLSGGLDSRTLLAILQDEVRNVNTFTYDTNPFDGSNLKFARKTANTLGISNETVEITPDGFINHIEQGVSITDGMIPWFKFVNPGFILGDLRERVDEMVLNTHQGEYFGDVPTTDNINNNPTPADALYDLIGSSHDYAETILNSEVNPKGSVVTEINKSNLPTQRGKMLETWHRTCGLESRNMEERLISSQVRVHKPLANSELIEHLLQMPDSYRCKGYWKPPLDRVWQCMSQMKRKTATELGGGVEKIPYERSRVPPSWPMFAHDIGLTTKYAYWEYVAGAPEPPAVDWYRTHEEFRSYIDSYIDDACKRDIFNEESIRRLQRNHQNISEDHFKLFSTISTIEIWLQQQGI